MSSFNVLLAGNPNCGKTALFNALTGSSQRVGNWPGVTVEAKQGELSYHQDTFKIKDLPGVYSLLSYGSECGLDEKIACDALLKPGVDLIVNVLDAANLERHLYLTTQLLDLGIPMVVAVNMLDVLERRGGSIDCAQLSARLGCPVVGIVASQQKNIQSLVQTIRRQCHKKTVAPSVLNLPAAITQKSHEIESALRKVVPTGNASFSVLRLFEGDACIATQLPRSIVEMSDRLQRDLKHELSSDIDLIFADSRYRFCSSTRQEVIRVVKPARRPWTEHIDRVVLNRYWGFPIFFFVMYLMFFFAINIGGAFQDFFDIGSDTLFVQGLAHGLAFCHAPGWLIAILANGLGKGVNTTITFIPMIAGLFLFLSFLEDSGYMARATFLMDRLMRALGLPGEAFVPMIVGFGCNVPAVMGARTLGNKRDRILTVVMMPFMSCGARFAIFTIFASAFFPHHGAFIIFLLYIIGIVAAVLTGWIFRRLCLSGASSPLVMELPNYHRPQWGSLWRMTSRRTGQFVKRAGRVIVPVCVVLGALNSITLQGNVSEAQANSHSILSVVGRTVTPVLAPMGIKDSNWPATVGLVTGVLAKEVVVGTLNSLYAQQAHLAIASSQFDFWGGMIAALQSVPANLIALKHALFNPVAASAADVSMNSRVYGVMEQQFQSRGAAFAYLVFVLLYFPCISTLAAMQREIGRRWALMSMGWSCGFAYAAAVMTYQIISIASVGWSAVCWVVVMFLFMLFIMKWLQMTGHRALSGSESC